MLIIQRNKYHPGRRKQKVMSLNMSLSTGTLTHWLPGFFEHFIGLQKLVIEFDQKDNNDDDNCNNSD